MFFIPHLPNMLREYLWYLDVDRLGPTKGTVSDYSDQRGLTANGRTLHSCEWFVEYLL